MNRTRYFAHVREFSGTKTKRAAERGRKVTRGEKPSEYLASVYSPAHNNGGAIFKVSAEMGLTALSTPR